MFYINQSATIDTHVYYHINSGALKACWLMDYTKQVYFVFARNAHYIHLPHAIWFVSFRHTGKITWTFSHIDNHSLIPCHLFLCVFLIFVYFCFIVFRTLPPSDVSFKLVLIRTMTQRWYLKRVPALKVTSRHLDQLFLNSM